MSTTERLVGNARGYPEHFTDGDLPLPPSGRVAVVACMDARLDPFSLLGLESGEAHVIRNAGGAVTQDVIRSLAISQRLLGTEEIVLIHHTDCGMLTFSDDEFRHSVEHETGVRPEWAAEAFSDLDDDVRQSIARIQASTRVRLLGRGRPASGDHALGGRPGATAARARRSMARVDLRRGVPGSPRRCRMTL